MRTFSRLAYASLFLNDNVNVDFPTRFYVLNRSRGGDPNCPEEDVEITGSTGNIYHVHIAQVPSCDCPHALKGNQCKHMVYVSLRATILSFNLSLYTYR